MAIIEKSQILTSSDQAGFQSFDGLARHRSNVFPVDLEQIIGHCSTYLAFGASPSQAGESFFTRPPSSLYLSCFIFILCYITLASEEVINLNGNKLYFNSGQCGDHNCFLVVNSKQVSVAAYSGIREELILSSRPASCQSRLRMDRIC